MRGGTALTISPVKEASLLYSTYYYPEAVTLDILKPVCQEVEEFAELFKKFS